VRGRFRGRGRGGLGAWGGGWAGGCRRAGIRWTCDGLVAAGRRTGSGAARRRQGAENAACRLLRRPLLRGRLHELRGAGRNGAITEVGAAGRYGSDHLLTPNHRVWSACDHRLYDRAPRTGGQRGNRRPKGDFGSGGRRQPGGEAPCAPRPQPPFLLIARLRRRFRPRGSRQKASQLGVQPAVEGLGRTMAHQVTYLQKRPGWL
jgi:hypothetical protein